MSIIRKHLSEVSEAMTLLDLDEVEKAAMAINVVRRNGGWLYLFGNGGSHATAGHFANDLMKMCRVKAMCIGDHTTAMLAYGNDNGWSRMFLDPLRALLKMGDGAVGISCSGNSENVLNAMEYALGEGVVTVGLTGNSLNSRINEIEPTALVHVPAYDIRVQEDVHLMVCHAVVRLLQEI